METILLLKEERVLHRHRPALHRDTAHQQGEGPRHLRHPPLVNVAGKHLLLPEVQAGGESRGEFWLVLVGSNLLDRLKPKTCII